MTKNLIYDVLMYAHENKNISYRKIAHDILDKYQKEFRDRDFVVDFNGIDITKKHLWPFLKYSPFQHVLKSEDRENRYYLYDDIQTILTPNDNELISIGSGYIGQNGIFVIGMAAGFFTNDADDKISQPFKPSFFFQNTSEMLRSGFGSDLKDVYFTNASKIAVEKNLMNESYESNYEKYWPILNNEIEFLKPRRILAAGTNVYTFLRKKGLDCQKIYHPSYFIYQGKQKESIYYYRNIIKG